MYALTIHQPYANQILDGVKTVENRSWCYPDFTGRIAIHASAKKIHGYQTGGILGTVNVLGYIQMQDGELVSPHPERLPDNINMDWYTSGSVGWVLSDPIRCDFIPIRGYQKLWKIPDELVLKYYLLCATL